MGRAAGRRATGFIKKRAPFVVVALSLACAAAAVALIADTPMSGHEVALGRSNVVIAGGSAGSPTQVLGMTLTAPAPSTATPPPGPGPSWPTNAKGILQKVKDDLNARLAGPPALDKDTKKHVQDAIADLTDALATNLWPVGGDGNHVDPKKGDAVYQAVKKAAKDLSDIKTPYPAWVVQDINALDYAARLIATTAINDNSCNAPKPREIDAANDEISKGDDEFGKSHYDAAVDHYKNAWLHALKANGEPCSVNGVLTLDPSGALFTVANFVPGDVAVRTVNVKLTGAPGTVTMKSANVGSTTCAACAPPVGTGTLSQQLGLQVLDTSNGNASIYSGPLNGFTSEVTICGAGTACAWNAGEQHALSLTVTFPAGSGNTFQGTGASLDFVWKATG